MTLLIVMGVASAVFNAALGTVSLAPAILYGLRVGEYFLVYPLVAMAINAGGQRFENRLRTLLAVVTVVQVTAAALQALLGLSVGFSRFSIERGAGLTSGPYELGAMCAALTVLWVAQRRYVLATIALVGVVLSASRISIAAVVIGLAVYVWLARRGRGSSDAGPTVSARGASRTVRPVVLACLAALAILTSASWLGHLVGGSVGRATSTGIVDSWNTSAVIAESMPAFSNSAQYAATAYVGFVEQLDINSAPQSADSSNLVRFYRWHLLLRSMTPTAWVAGLGPSFAGPSVDGALLRIIVETGIIGAAAWVFLANRAWRASSAWTRGVLVTFLIGSIFIDLFFAFRPSVLIWTMLALGQSFKEVEVDAARR